MGPTTGVYEAHILQCGTTHNGGALPGEARPSAKRAASSAANFNVAPVDSATNEQARMERHAASPSRVRTPYSDELFIGRATIATTRRLCGH
jgi:hypothetical protein